MSSEPTRSQLPADLASRPGLQHSSPRQHALVSALPLLLTIATSMAIAFVVIAVTALTGGTAVAMVA